MLFRQDCFICFNNIQCYRCHFRCYTFIAGFQTLFILRTHSPKNYQSRRRYCMNFCETLHKRFVFYFCSLLGVLNLGLWISDSIEEERLPVFSIAIYKAYDADVWSVINKIILPLTIFFRFHTGVDFLEYFWHQKKYRIQTKQKIHFKLES